jgi:hypothetical protein
MASGAFMFLDYANALNYGAQWENGKAETVTLASLPPLLRESVDSGVLTLALKAIEELRDTTIEGIVTRLPDDYMTVDYKKIVVNGLKVRRSRVRAAVMAGLGL